MASDRPTDPCAEMADVPVRRTGLTVEDRFWAKVNRTETCWLWTGYLTTKGYGRFSISARNQPMAYRYAYELLVGPIPEGLQVDHLCRVRHCVNPAHLEPVTGLENIRRAAEAKTHCKHGHEYTPQNTGFAEARSGGRYRRCRECDRLNAASRRARRSAA